MNTDFPTDPREALEASLTALVLGELPPEQAAFLRDTIGRDPQLAKRFERLQQTIELVRTTAQTPAEEKPSPSLKLSQERREQLLQHFKTVAPKEFTEKPRPKTSWLIPVSIAALLVAVCGYLLLPALARSKSRGTLSLASRVEPEGKFREGSVRRFPGTKPNDSEKQVADHLEESMQRIQRERAKKSTPSSFSLSPEAARSQTRVVLPPAAEAPQAQRPSAAADPNSVAAIGLPGSAAAGGGGGGYGGGAPVPSPTKEETGQIAAFRRRYGLEAGKELKTPSGKGDELANNESALTIDPVTGLPSQIPNLPDVAAVGSLATSTEPSGPTQKPAESVIGTTTGEENKDAKPDWAVTAGSRAFYDADGPAVNGLAAAEPRDHFDQAFTYNKPDSRIEQADLSYGLSTNVTIQGLGEVPPTMLAEIDLEKELLGRDLGRKTGERDSGVAPAVQPQIDSPNQVLTQLGAMPAKGDESIRFFKAKRELEERIKQRQDLYLSHSVTSSTKTGALTFGGIDAVREPVMEQQLEAHPRVEPQQRALEIKREAAASDDNAAKSVVPPSIPQPEVQTRENAFSTFSLNVSDVSFKLAAASLEKGTMPDPAGIRVEEFINAFDYRDPEPGPGVPIGFTWERAQYPFAHNRNLLRFSLKTAAQGRQTGRPLNLVVLLDNSGSMERADRVRIIQEALRVLAAQLQPQDKLSVVTFARTARLWADGLPGNQAGKVADEISGLTPEGGTNLEEAMNLAYQTALRHYLAGGMNRVVLLTDGAANLGNVDPETLKQKVEANRKQGVALDCFGIGWEGYNDDLLEVLTRNGDGRYGFINTPEEAATGFANQLAGALQVAAADVKVQVEFNPNRVTAYRQIGYAKHQLTKEQFRDNTVDAAEIGAAESGNALYLVQINPNGEGPLATVRVRYKVPGTSEYHEQEWPVPYTGNASPLQQASPALRLAGTASAFAEWLAVSPYAAEVTPDALLGYLNGIPEIYGADARPKTLEWMLRQAKSLTGK